VLLILAVHHRALAGDTCFAWPSRTPGGLSAGDLSIALFYNGATGRRWRWRGLFNLHAG